MLSPAMSRGSFGRSVARAAASGGGTAYGARRPVGWYLMMLIIVVAGVSLVVYSRQERVHPVATEGPTASDSWHVAFAIDICGKVQQNLPANSNLATTGIRTLGDGIIYVAPSSASSGTPANFEGAKANLSTFVSNYPKLTLTSTSLGLPTTGTYVDGDSCTSPPKSATTPTTTPAAATGVTGKTGATGATGATASTTTTSVPAAEQGAIRIETWSSPTAKGVVASTSDLSKLHFTDGEMITIGFVTTSEKLPEPPSKTTLLGILGGGSSTTTTS